MQHFKVRVYRTPAPNVLMIYQQLLNANLFAEHDTTASHNNVK